jgi:transcription termination factor Rho
LVMLARLPPRPAGGEAGAAQSINRVYNVQTPHPQGQHGLLVRPPKHTHTHTV